MRNEVLSPANFNSFLTSFFGDDNPLATTDRSSFFTPSVDMVEKENDYTIHVTLPGVKKSEITVDLKEDVLTISGERKQEDSNEGATWIKHEIVKGAFKRTFRLPKYVNKEGIKAKMNDGILEVTVPKGEAQKPKTIKVG